MDQELINDLLNNITVRICLIIIATGVLQLISKATIGIIINRALIRDSHYSKDGMEKRAKTLSSMFRKIIAFALWVVAVILILSELNINIAAVLTGAGFLGVVLGFGAQNSIKDILAGMFIIFENQFRVGDIVRLQAGGTEISGVVKEVTVRITKLRDLDGRLHFVPNGSIDIVTNMTFEYASVNLDIGIDYQSDIDKVEKVMNNVGASMSKEDKWDALIKEPIKFLRVNSFDDSQITIKALGKVKAGSQWEVAGEYRRRLKKEFDKNKINIPFPQIVVHQARK